MISTFLWAFIILIIYVVTISLLLTAKETEKSQYFVIEKLDLEILPVLITVVKRAFAFYEIVDSRFIGLIIFLNANILTGLINLSINTKKTLPPISLLILILHAFLSIGSGYLVYYYFKFYRSENNLRSIKNIV